MLIPLGRQWTVEGRRSVLWSRFLSYSWLNVCNNLISFEFWPFWPSLRIEWFFSSSSPWNSHVEMTNKPIKCIADCCHLTTHIYISLVILAKWDWQLETLLAGIMKCSLLLSFVSVLFTENYKAPPADFLFPIQNKKCQISVEGVPFRELRLPVQYISLVVAPLAGSIKLIGELDRDVHCWAISSGFYKSFIILPAIVLCRPFNRYSPVRFPSVLMELQITKLILIGVC